MTRAGHVISTESGVWILDDPTLTRFAGPRMVAAPEFTCAPDSLCCCCC